MKFFSLFITKSNNGINYPSFLSRSIYAVLATFSILNFDYAATGKNIADDNYWIVKAIVFVCALLVTECIYQIHKWCVRKYAVKKSLALAGLIQFILGLVIPTLSISLLLKGVVGLTFQSDLGLLATRSAKAIAMIPEFIGIANFGFGTCYLIAASKTIDSKIERLDEIVVSQSGVKQIIQTKNIDCIFRYYDKNIIFTNDGAHYETSTELSLADFLRILPAGTFELRKDAIFKTTIDKRSEDVFRKYADNILKPSPNHN